MEGEQHVAQREGHVAERTRVLVEEGGSSEQALVPRRAHGQIVDGHRHMRDRRELRHHAPSTPLGPADSRASSTMVTAVCATRRNRVDAARWNAPAFRWPE